MPRINRQLSHPHGGFVGRPISRDRMKRQRSHEWFERAFNNPTIPRRPTIDEILKENELEDAKAWDNNPMGDWPDV